MASALMILFLGCWLAGQSGVSGEGTDSAGIQEQNHSVPETGEEEGAYPAGAQQPDPTTMEPEGEDAGSIPAGGTDLTQPGKTSVPTHPGSTRPEETNTTQLETTPIPTHPSSTGPGTGVGGSKSPSTAPKTGGPEPSPAPGLTCAVIAGVSAAAAGLLLVAFLCYRRKGRALTQTRESQPATTVYALMGEGMQQDVLPQKPDPGAEGHTYAELDGQALQAKQGGAAPAPELPLYSTITMSQGPNGQSPQGAGEPPTDPHSVNPGRVTGETGQEASATTG